MQVNHLWATPVSESEHHLSPETTTALISLLERRDAFKSKIDLAASPFKEYVDSGDFYNEIHYNLFASPEHEPAKAALLEFERYACKTFREYLQQGFDAKDSDTVELSARCFGHIHRPGMRTFPHYHQASDGVLIHYLKADEQGEGGEPLSLILQDPRGAPNYPWQGKMHTINPKTGTTVCHPSYLWHETNEWTGKDIRALIAVNFKVIGHGHENKFQPTKF
jgi:hypothetical protein